MGVGEDVNGIEAVTVLPGHQFHEEMVSGPGTGSVAGSPIKKKSTICCPPGVHDTTVGVGVGVGLGVDVAVGVGVTVDVGVAVGADVPTAVGDALTVDETVGVAVATWVGVLVGTVDVPVPVGTGVLVETAVAVAEAALVAVDVAEPEGPDVEQGTGVGVIVGCEGWVDEPDPLSDATFMAYTLY